MPKPNMKKFGRTAKFKQHHFSVADGARGSGQDQPEQDVILVEDEDGDVTKKLQFIIATTRDVINSIVNLVI